MLFEVNKILTSTHIHRRTFFGALNAIFNNVSPRRVKLVGPDRACAEWLMRNGGHVKWVGGEDFVAHYDSLPLDDSDTTPYHIEEIFAKDASISHHGFPHLKGCSHVKRITLNKCRYVNDKCIDSFEHISQSLQALDIQGCQDITESGLHKIGELNLRKLTCLRLGNLLEPQQLLNVVQNIQKRLPNCTVEMVMHEEEKSKC